MAAVIDDLRILLVDDHPLVRMGVRLSLERCDGHRVVGEANNGDDALRLALELRPQILIIDVEMPGLSSLQVIDQALAAMPDLKVLILTSHADAETIRKFRKTKVAGYLLKEESPEDLLQAIRAVCNGHSWHSRSIAPQMAGIDPGRQTQIHFTPRETQVIRMIAAGHDNSTIAKTFHLAEQTVRNYSTTIYEKIGVASRVEAVIWAESYEFN